MATQTGPVTDDGDLFDFQCPGVPDSPCGTPGTPFRSTGWPTKKAAAARGRQHADEHQTGAPMQPLDDFRADRGLGI